MSAVARKGAATAVSQCRKAFCHSISTRSFTFSAKQKFSNQYSTESEKPKGRLGTFFVISALIGVGAGGIYYYHSRKKDSSEADLMKDVGGLLNNLTDAAFEKLLPEKISDPNHPRPYTLVIDLDKFLVCHLWDPQQNRWRIAKRPGADLFLFYASQFYEVVVFSALQQFEGDAIVKKLDPYGCISHSLFRFATRVGEGGRVIKDVGRLNRDLSKIVVLGHDAIGFGTVNQENFIRMAPWEGRPDDRTLEDSLDFLEMLAFSNLPDIRPVLQKHRGNLFPDDFEAKQKASFDLTRRIQMESQEQRSKSLFFRLFGLVGSFGGLSAASPAKGLPTYHDGKQDRIEMRRKEYAKIKDLMEKQLQAEMQKEKEFYAEHKMSLFDLFSKGPPPPPPPQKEIS